MELVIGIALICVGIFIYGYAMANSWEKKYKIKMGYYFNIQPEKAAKMKTIQGTCRFDDIESPAASSPAALILLPVDKRSIATFISEFDLLRLARTIEDI